MVTKEQIERVLNDNTLDIEEKVDKDWIALVAKLK